jgi:hypothetical protein
LNRRPLEVALLAIALAACGQVSSPGSPASTSSAGSSSTSASPANSQLVIDQEYEFTVPNGWSQDREWEGWIHVPASGYVCPSTNPPGETCQHSLGNASTGESLYVVLVDGGAESLSDETSALSTATIGMTTITGPATLHIDGRNGIQDIVLTSSSSGGAELCAFTRVASATSTYEIVYCEPNPSGTPSEQQFVNLTLMPFESWSWRS